MSRAVRTAVCAAISLLTVGLFVAVPTPAQASVVRYYHAFISPTYSGTHYSYWYRIPAGTTISVDSSCGNGGSVVVVDSHGNRMWGPHVVSGSQRAHFVHAQANRSA